MENNDKAKRILFGRTDIGDERLPKGITKIEGGGWHFNIDLIDEKELRQWHESWLEKNKEDYPGLVKYIQEHGYPLLPKTDILDENAKEFAKNVAFIKQEDLILPPSDEELADRKYWRDAMNTLRDYCHDNNCSIQDLIEAHKKLRG